jgi:hypothetical protein
MEMRESIVVADAAPQLILVGPARLLHVQIEREGAVRVFRAPRHDGTSADCRGAPGPADADAWPLKRAVVDISKDEVICAKVGKVGKVDRKARLSWHARGLPDEPQGRGSMRQASLLP